MNEKLKVLDLFSGIGGFSLGLERTGGFETVAFCEIEEYPRRVLAKHWPDVEIFKDVTNIKYKSTVDLVTAGFPCQDISLAGQGAGLFGDRSGLFWYILRTACMVGRPKLLLENVAALLNRGLCTVLGALASFGYDAEWDSFPTCLDLGHRRDRTFIVAHDVCQGLSERSDTYQDGIDATPIFTRERFAGILTPIAPASLWSDRCLMGRGISRIPGRVGRVTGCGNSVRPKIPEMIGYAILEAETPETVGKHDK